MDRPEGFGEAALLPAFYWGQALRWRRTIAGFKTNVRWIVRHHSLVGFDIGYAGSGPSDLALNAMANLFHAEGEETERLFDGTVSRRAWTLHQDFKFKFLAGADPDKGWIEWETIEVWLDEQEVPGET
jgi:hypothetical protein